MKKVKQIVFEKKYLLIFLFLSLIFLFMFISALKEMLFANNGNIYGDRLEGIENIKITEDIIMELKNNLLLSQKVNDVSVKINGRLVNIIIDIKDKIDIIDSKQLAEKSLEFFLDEQKKYYDFQYFLVQNDKKTNDLYPIIGTKHKLKTIIVWTK